MKKVSKISVVLMALIMLVTLVPTASAGARNGNAYQNGNMHVDYTTYGWALDNAEKNEDGTVTVTIMEVPNFEQKTYTTAISLDDAKHKSPVTDVTRADALTTVLAKNSFVEILFNKKGDCIDMERIENDAPAYMDSASYGGELTAKNGGPGKMVAQGWVLNKNKNKRTITIGDGNSLTSIFNQTYKLARDVKIYVVDSPSASGTRRYNSDGTWGLVKVGDFDDIVVTEKTNGEIYFTPERWQALCIFDSNYKKSWKKGKAKVKELYIWSRPQTLSNLYEPDGMTYSATSWYPLYSRAEVNETSHGYGGSMIEPIEFMKNRLYCVGDTYTSIMMFVGDNGTTSLLDMGNSTSCYQYYLNLERIGYDPRSVDNIFLTHGHFDHMGAMYEFCTMVRRGGNPNFNAWINPYAEHGATFTSDLGNVYELGGTISDKGVLYSVNEMLEWDKWLDFMGGGTSVYIWRAMGHSKDTAAFVIKLKAKRGDAYFKKGDVVSFVYYGGYAVQQRTSGGAMRLALLNGLQYEQSVITPWAEAQSDYVYPLAQHTNQISILEIAKASKIAGIPFMKGYVGGAEEIGNYCENRVSNMMYQWINDAFENDYSDNLSQILRDAGLPVPDTYDLDLAPAAPADTVYVEGTRGTKRFDTIEEHGPWKRPEGVYDIAVKSVTVVHGYDAFMNKNPLFADQTNVYGFTLDQGFVILWDTYPHDPDGWYVQVVCDVDDDYDGGVDHDNNWWVLDGNDYTTNYDNKGERPVAWESGPVELVNTPERWDEILRTERFDTREEAEAYAEALTNGAYSEPYKGYSVNGGPMYAYGDTANHEIDDYGTAPAGRVTYTVHLDKTSQIILKDSFEDTFTLAD